MREREFIHDKSGKRPLDVPKAVLGFMHRMANSKTCSEWWAHNGGKFDVLFLVHAAVDLGWTLQGVCSGSRAIQVEFRAPDGVKFKCRDSYAVIQGSLKSALHDFDCASSKLFTVEDYATDPRTWDVARLKAGCLVDCDGVLELLEKVETQAEDWGGKLGLTFSATALSVIKARVGEFPEHGEKFRRAHEVANGARKGGRVEVFHHLPPGKLIEFDIASSYPWAMSQNLPWEPLGFAKGKAGQDKVLSGAYEGFVEATVYVPPCDLPPLPYRHDGALYFPVGKFTDWFAACELRHAMQNGAKLLRVLDATAYRPAAPFKEVIADLYRLKATSKGAVRQFVKLCLNGAYGKLAQGSDVEQLQVMESADEAYELAMSRAPGRVTQVGRDPRIVSERQTRLPRHTHFAAASYILALARIRLHQGLIACEEPAYSDTDSIHCTAEGTMEDLLNNELGGFKVEAENYTARFYAPKIYEMHFADGKSHYASKGFPVEASAFRKLVAGEPVEVHRIRGLKSQIKSDNGPERIREEKSWHGVSGKRYARADGTTRPWTVKEILDEAPSESISPSRRDT